MADVSISKSVKPTMSIVPSDWITYTLTYTNAAPTDAENVVITDMLPVAYLVNIGYTADPPVTATTGITYAWQVGTLKGLEGGTITITAQVAPTITDPHLVFTNTAWITTTTPEGDYANNSDWVTTTLQTADVQVSKSGPMTTYANSTITYTIVYTNAGPAVAENVVITDTLPLTYLVNIDYTTEPPVTATIGTTYTWQVGTLRELEGGVITITAQVVPTITDPHLVFTNTAWITTTTPEGDYANNSDWVTTTLQTADVQVSKSGPLTTYANSSITYTIFYSNAGPATAENVIITDTLPLSVTYESASVTPVITNPVVWDIDSVAAGDGSTIVLTATVPSLPPLTKILSNTVSISTLTLERNATNNVDNWVTDVRGQHIYLPMILKGYPPAIVTNGGFEETEDFIGWVHGGELPQSIAPNPHSGSYSALLGMPVESSEQPTSSAWMYQTVTVPSDMPSPTFSFWYRIVTNDIRGWASFHVEVRDSSGTTTLAEVLYGGYDPPDNVAIPNNDLGWKTHSYDVSPYKGQTISLWFESKNEWNGALGIWTYVDDVRVD